MTSRNVFEKVAGKTANFNTRFDAKTFSTAKTSAPKFIPPSEEAGNFFRDRVVQQPNNISRFQKLFQANSTPVHLKRGMSDMLMYRGALTLSFIGIGVSIYAIGCMATGTLKKKE